MPSSGEIKKQNRLLAQQQDIMQSLTGALNGATASAMNLSRALQGAVSYANQIDADMITVARSTNEASDHAHTLGTNLRGAAASGIDALKNFGSSMGGHMKNAATSAFETVTHTMGSIGEISKSFMSLRFIAGFSALFTLITSNFEKTTMELRAALGTVFTNPQVNNNINQLFRNLESKVISSGMSFGEVVGTAEMLSNEFGMAMSQTADIAFNIGDGARALSVSANTMANIVGNFQLAYDLSAEQSHELSEQVGLLAAMNDVAPKAVLEDIAASTEDMARFSAGGVKNFIKAAIQARKLGMNVKDVANTMNGLLNFEDSLNKELQASIMLGRRINLNEARRAAFAGDAAGAMAAVTKELGNIDLQNLDPLTLQAVADAANLTTHQLLKVSKGADEISGQDIGEESMSGLNTELLAARETMGEMQKITADFNTMIRELAQKHGEKFFSTVRRTFDFLMETNFLENMASFMEKLIVFVEDFMKAPLFHKDAQDKLHLIDPKGEQATKLSVLKGGIGDIVKGLGNMMLKLFGIDSDMDTLIKKGKDWLMGEEMDGKRPRKFFEGIWFRIKEAWNSLMNVKLPGTDDGSVGGVFSWIWESIKKGFTSVWNWLTGPDGFNIGSKISELFVGENGAFSLGNLIPAGIGGGKIDMGKLIEEKVDVSKLENIKEDSKIGKTMKTLNDFITDLIMPKLTTKKFEDMFRDVNFEDLKKDKTGKGLSDWLKFLIFGDTKKGSIGVSIAQEIEGGIAYVAEQMRNPDGKLKSDIDAAISGIFGLDASGNLGDQMIDSLTAAVKKMNQPGGLFEMLGVGLTSTIATAFSNMKVGFDITKLIPGGDKPFNIKIKDSKSGKFVSLDEFNEIRQSGNNVPTTDATNNQSLANAQQFPQGLEVGIIDDRKALNKLFDKIDALILKMDSGIVVKGEG